ncbi:MAG: Sec-independent protein translocase protein TatB [Pseudomonadota bacterium]
MFFEFGFPELMVIAAVGLIVIGPERLPEMLRTLGLWLGRLRRSFVNVKAEIEKEIGMDEVKRQLHNESVMEEMRRIEQEVNNSMNESILGPDATANSKSDHSTSEAQSSEDATSTAAEAEQEPAIQEESGQEKNAPKPVPPSEAELEAAHAARARRESNQ